MAMTKREIGKTVLIILVLNIILPTADVVTDLLLIEKLYRGFPVCNQLTEGIRRDIDEYNKCRDVGADQYCIGEKISTGVCGVRNESNIHNECRNHTYWSREYQVYKQCLEVGYDNYCSDPSTTKNVCEHVNHPKMGTAMFIPFCLNYIFCFITFFRIGTEKKKTFIFPLLNLYPQFEAAKVILAIIEDPETGLKSRRRYDQYIGLHETFLEAVPTTLILTHILKSIYVSDTGSYVEKIIIGESELKEELFCLTFFLSFFSASLGLAKCLKNGVARNIATGGPMDGLLSGRFILAFIASGFSLFLKGIFIGDTLNNFLLFLPQLLLAIFSTLDLSSRNSLKILISHPSLILLPVFTFFTFSKIQCCGDRRVKFSVRFTLINMAISVGLIVATTIIDTITNQISEAEDVTKLVLGGIIFFFLIILVIFFTLIFLYMDKLCRCCCSCFLSAPGQLSVFDPDHPEKTFIYENGQAVELKEVNGGAMDTAYENNITTEENEQTE